MSFPPSRDSKEGELQPSQRWEQQQQEKCDNEKRGKQDKQRKQEEPKEQQQEQQLEQAKRPQHEQQNQLEHHSPPPPDEQHKEQQKRQEQQQQLRNVNQEKNSAAINDSEAAKALARSERKRCREKQRRFDENKQFADLTQILRFIDEEENKEAKMKKEGAKPLLTSFNPTNRVDLISRTVRILEHLHKSSKELKLEVKRRRKELKEAKQAREEKESLLKQTVVAGRNDECMMMAPMMMPDAMSGGHAPMMMPPFMHQAATYCPVMPTQITASAATNAPISGASTRTATMQPMGMPTSMMFPFNSLQTLHSGTAMPSRVGPAPSTAISANATTSPAYSFAQYSYPPLMPAIHPPFVPSPPTEAGFVASRPVTAEVAPANSTSAVANPAPAPANPASANQPSAPANSAASTPL